MYYPVTGGLLAQDQSMSRPWTAFPLKCDKGEVFGIVGESGCGKVHPWEEDLQAGGTHQGEIILDGEDISKYNARQMRPVRKKVQMVFQDPYASLNPRMSVFDIIAEPLIIHGLTTSKRRWRPKCWSCCGRLAWTITMPTGIPTSFPADSARVIGIARALAVQPKLIIADEPVSALDVSIQAQVLNLMNKLKKEFNLTYIFVAHDLSVVEHISDRVGVMYLGNFVEVGNKDSLYQNPLHPYTQALLSAVPVPDPTVKRERIILEGNIPSALNPPERL